MFKERIKKIINDILALQEDVAAAAAEGNEAWEVLGITQDMPCAILNRNEYGCDEDYALLLKIVND